MDVADLESLVSTASLTTYGFAIAVLVVERVVLRGLDHPVSERGGVASLLSGVLGFGGIAVANLLLYVAVMHGLWSMRVIDPGLGPGAWLALFVLYDGMFYVGHRMGHRVRLLWCFHSVHHTAEEMRLTTAIRGSAGDFLYLPWFFVWIPLLGFHPAMVLIVESAARIWGVCTHISPRLVGQLGALDRILVTPSVHRVHHGRNAPYIDRNYGEVLLIWDHLFGSYTAEEEEPEYGVLKEVDAGSLVDIQLSPWVDLARDLRAAPTWTARFRTLFDGPEYRYDASETAERDRA